MEDDFNSTLFAGIRTRGRAIEHMLNTHTNFFHFCKCNPTKYTHTHTHTKKTPKQLYQSLNSKNKQKTMTHHLPTGPVHWHHAARTNRKVVEYLDHYYGDTQASVLQTVVPEYTQPHTARCLTISTNWNRSNQIRSRTHIGPPKNNIKINAQIRPQSHAKLIAHTASGT